MMNQLNKQELQVIQAFSSVSLPEKIFSDSNIKALIKGMTEAQASVQKNAKNLESVRKEQKDGNFITNWWNDRDDLLQDAQIDLNKSIGLLTQKSSQLLIVNTAISKLLNQQQQTLLNQQTILEGQTRSLGEQNQQILKQQLLLEEQQKEINKANQGLMDAKGITQEQAKQLVGCVKRVTEAENKIGAANALLLADIEQRVTNCEADFARQLQNGLEEQGRVHSILEKTVTASHAVLQASIEEKQQSLSQEQQQFHQKLLTELELSRSSLLDLITTVTNQSDAFQADVNRSIAQHAERQTSTDAIVEALHMQFRQSRGRHRLAMVAIACITGLSIGWQIVQHYSLL